MGSHIRFAWQYLCLVAAGSCVFAIMVASGLVQGQWRWIVATRWPPTQLRNLVITLVASVIALCTNPYGYRLVFYPLDLAIRQGVAVNHVIEWASVDFRDPRGKVVILLTVGLLLGALLSRHQWKLHELGLVLFGLYSGLTHIRFLFLAALLIAPLRAKFLDTLHPISRKSTSLFSTR